MAGDYPYRWKLTLTPANIGRNFELSTQLHGPSENWGFRVVVPKNARCWTMIEVATPCPPIYRQLLSSRDPSDPYDNQASRDDDAETSLLWRRPMESGQKLKNFTQCSLVSTWVSIYRLSASTCMWYKWTHWSCSVEVHTVACPYFRNQFGYHCNHGWPWKRPVSAVRYCRKTSTWLWWWVEVLVNITIGIRY